VKGGKMMRWQFFLLVLGLVFFVSLGGIQAQEKYPNRPIELVVPMTPGGVGDITVRIYSEELSRVLNVPITVVNRAGGAGIQGTSYVIRAKKDGYTLLAGSVTFVVILPIISKEATYDPLKDLVPIGHFVYVPNVLTVKNDSPFQTLNELIEYARKNPGKLKYGTSGIGSADYFNVEILCSKTNTKMTAIPFKGGGEALVSLLGGHVDLTFQTLATNSPQIKAGKIRALAITSKTRSPDFPNIPTTAELGHPYPFLDPWVGVFGPAGLPQPVLNVLVPALEKVFKNPEVVGRATKAALIVEYKDPEEFRKFIESQIQIVEKIAQDANLIKK